MSTFKSLGLNENLLKAITDLGFETPSEVQQKTIPILLEQDTDLVSLAQTGTGKTAAFGFPMLQKIDINSRTTQGLILSPTRELCLQITNEMKLYGKYCKGLNVVAVYGGSSITDQAREIKRGAQIIVATPGRMKDMISRRLVDISKIEYAVLDEADEMLNMVFYEDITDILAHTPKDKSTWLFSATMPKEVSTIAKKFMHNPTEITVGKKNQGATNVSHEYYLVNARDRYLALKRLADANPDIFSVVFCRTKRDTQKVAEHLIEDGYSAGALHGDLSQNQRDLVMKSFRNKQIQMLVATDVAARGIDVEDITHVINYQLPDEIETYTHRSGRTGRAGKSGVSMVIVTKSEERKIRTLEKIIKKKFTLKPIPTGIEICEKQLFYLAHKIKDTEINHQVDEYLPKIHQVLDGLDREELIKKIVSVEFTRFFDYYNKTQDISSPESSVEGNANPNSIRYFINVGRRDGYTWGSLKDFIRELTQLSKDDVYKVDVKDTFSFFNTDPEHMPKILEVFTDLKIDGRFVNVEVSSKPEDGSGRRSRRKDRGDRSDRRDRGGRRDRSDRSERSDRGNKFNDSKPGRRFSGSKDKKFSGSKPKSKGAKRKGFS